MKKTNSAPNAETRGKKRKSFDSAAPASASASASAGAASEHKKAKTAPASGSGPATASAATSILVSAAAQTDFPRGGASVLTPLEHRQALREARAEADALFKDSSALPSKAARKAANAAGAAADAAGVSDVERNRAGLAKQKHNRDKRNALKKKHALPSDAAAAAAANGNRKKDFLRIEHLNYKRLQSGARLLCTVLAVHPFALVLSLPGQLLGHVPITAISPIFTDRLQSMADADDQEDDDDEDSDSSDEEDDDDDQDGSDDDDGPTQGSSKRNAKPRASDVPELRDLFTVGQWVHATVTDVLSPSAVKAAHAESSASKRSREGGEYEYESRRVVLSLNPADFNSGVVVDELGQGYVLPAAVKSVEDHGYLLDLGLEAGVSAFCAFKDAPGGGAKKSNAQKLQVGQVVPAAVLSVGDNKRSVTVTLKPKDVQAAFLGSKATPPSLSGLLPGLAFDALITANLPAGLNVKLFGLFDATIDRAHLPALKAGQAYETFFKEGRKIRARVFWELGDLHAQQLALGEGDDDDDANGAGGRSGGAQYRKIALSAADHVLALEPPVVSVVGGIDPSAPPKVLSDAFPIGTKLRVTITRVDADWGLYATLASSGSQRLLMGADAASLAGFVHISSVSDKRIDMLSDAETAPYRVGTTHDARVISHAPTDRLLLLSLKPSVLALKFMRVSEVSVGDIMKGTIVKADEAKMVVDIGGLHHGAVFPSHFSDIQLKSKKLLSKYKPGLSVQVRVWDVNPGKNRIVLTLKKTLLQSDLPVVGSLQDARVGVVTHAVVSRLPDPASRSTGGGLLVDLYGGLRAFVPASETSEGNEVPTVSELHTRFFEGKVVKVRLTSVDYDTGRLMASVRQALPAFQERLNVSQYDVGQKVSGTVAAVHEDIVVLNVAPTQARGLVSLQLLARMRDVEDVEALRAELSEGDVVEGLQVWSKSEEKGLLHLNDARAVSLHHGAVAAAAANGANGKAKDRAANGANVGAVIDSLVVRSKRYRALVKSHASRGEHNAVQLRLYADDASEAAAAHSADDGTSSGATVLAHLHVTDAYDAFDDAAGAPESASVQGVPRGEGNRAAANLPAVGSTLECIVVDVEGAGYGRRVHLSVRPSVLGGKKAAAASSVRDQVVNEPADLVIGSKYRGFVRGIADGGLTVDLGRSVQARVKVREAVDVLTKEWKDAFEIGKLVEGRILSVKKNGNKTLVDMTLRTPKEERAKQKAKDKAAKDASSKKGSSKLAFQHGLEQFSKGQKVKCYVKSIKDEIGLFLQIEVANTNVSGLCHKSEVADNGSPEALKAYSVGDRVKAIILKINQEDKKISFGLKPSYFSDADFLDSDDEQDEEMEGLDHDDEDEEDDDEDEDEDDDESMDENEDGLSMTPNGDAVDSDDEEMDDDDDDDQDESDDEDGSVDMGGPSAMQNGNGVATASASKSKKEIAPLSLAGGFSWSGAGADDAAEDDDEDAGSDSSSEADETEAVSKRQSAKAKGKQAASSAVDLDEKLPESVSDFERLLLGSPNNSFLWIQFMSFQLQLSDVEAARQVAQRALKVINYREEQEKLNVWVALLNLEDQYGTEASLDAAFKEAVAANDAETVYMRMLTILEKSHKLAKADAIWTRAVKKFNGSMGAWSGYARFLLRHGRAEDVRALMARAQQSLPKHRHVELIKAFALAEFAVGEPERGRTLFERLVDGHPKKLDLWLLYLDQETKAGNIAAARSLYERVLVLPQSTKKAKAVLKKWHAFESKHGTPKDVERVVKRAREFVEATVQKRAGGGGVGAASGAADEEDEDEDEDEDDDDLVDDEDDE